MKRGILIGLTAGLVAVCAKAQTGGIGDPGTARGTPRSSYALSGIDNINYYNGNLNVSIPIAAIGGLGEGSRAIKVTIEQQWAAYDAGGSYVPFGKSQPTIAPVYAVGSLSAYTTGGPAICPVFNQDGSFSYYRSVGPFTTYITWDTGNGTSTVLTDVAFSGQPQGANITTCAQLNSYQQANRGRVFRSTDGSNLTFIADADVIDEQVSGGIKGTLITAGGVRYRFSTEYSYLGGISDRNGNAIQFSWQSTSSGDLYTATDPLGRATTINYTQCLDFCNPTPNTQDVFTYPGFGGAARTVRVNYSKLQNVLTAGKTLQTYKCLFPELYGSSTTNYNPWVISSVVLPDGHSYTMQYNSYGELVRLRCLLVRSIFINTRKHPVAQPTPAVES